MGLFVQRPEEPSEWAGLPGEPARPQTEAELLPDDDRPAASPTGLLGLADDSTTSIEISLGDSAQAADGD
ncbi:hypothetical protein [uncultured Microbacterium sp.]|uniref:hypothetical protein n=1 Tax=uncultured Microbacterium sp. TaxID=191216 RepID=UPI0028D864BF|nr:hypothetical protein [uncultured Microbacterium sp.]